MFITKEPLILASNSPRRKEFFQQAGLEFSVCSADVDESIITGEAAEQYVERLARAKAEDVGRRHPDKWVIGADTIVVCDDTILGKPKDDKHAVEMLSLLSGRKHQVFTSFCVVRMDEGAVTSRLVVTDVFFDSLSHETVKNYIATGEPLDKAGAYGIQGIGGMLVRRICGSYTNVVGLPMAELLGVLRDLGVIE